MDAVANKGSAILTERLRNKFRVHLGLGHQACIEVTTKNGCLQPANSSFFGATTITAVTTRTAVAVAAAA